MESIGNSPFISWSWIPAFLILFSSCKSWSMIIFLFLTLLLLPLGSGPNCREWWLAKCGRDGQLSLWSCKCNPRNWWGHELCRDAQVSFLFASFLCLMQPKYFLDCLFHFCNWKNLTDMYFLCSPMTCIRLSSFAISFHLWAHMWKLVRCSFANYIFNFFLG